MAFLVKCFQVELEFRMLVFVEGGKVEVWEKNLGARMRTNKKHNTHVTPGPEIKPRPQW